MLQRIIDLHLPPQTEKWRALQRAISLAAWFVRLLSEVALILCGCTAHGPREQPCFAAQFLLNFQGLHNFPPAVSHNFWLLSICQEPIVLLTWPLVTILCHITETQVNNHLSPNLWHLIGRLRNAFLSNAHDLMHELMQHVSWIPIAHHSEMIKSLRVYVIS